jgi:hypothetical protein
MGTYVRTQSIEADIGASGHLGIRTTASDTRIRAIEGGTARVRATFQISADSEADADRIYAEYQLRVARDGGSLDVEEPRNAQGGIAEAVGRLLGRAGRVDVEIDVEAPAACELRFEGVSADVTADGLRGEQRYQSVSGDLLLTNVAGELRINGVSADVTVRGADALALRNNAVSGDLSAMAPRFAALQANSVSGDVEIEGAFDARGDHRLETVSGDVTIGLLGGATFDVRGMSTDISCRLPHQLSGQAERRRLIVGDGSAQVRFSSMSGDLSVVEPRRLAAPRTSVAPSAQESEPHGVGSIEILRALERGEIDVEEASRRLAQADR